MAQPHSAGTDGDTAAFRRITRAGVGWIAAGLAPLALFGAWLAVMSYNGHLGDMVRAPPGPSYYVADFNSPQDMQIAAPRRTRFGRV